MPISIQCLSAAWEMDLKTEPILFPPAVCTLHL